MRSGGSNQLIALVGPPNSGKTTLFNWLTGSRFRAVNYPGATVDCYIGETLSHYGEQLNVVDTPGTYSLAAKSPDEKVTIETLFEERLGRPIAHVVVVVNATQLGRHLFLVRQLKAAGFALTVALTMMDLISENEQEIDFSKLSSQLNVPVVPVDGKNGEGVKLLVETVRSALKSTPTQVNLPIEYSGKEQIDNLVREGQNLAKSVTKGGDKHPAAEKTWRMDRIFLHPILGVFSFILIMTIFFSSIFWLAAPLMDLVDSGFAWLGQYLISQLGQNLATDFLSNGVITSFAAVMVFVPQIFILFTGLSVLEDSGYLARAATLIDRPFSKLGLSGRAFVPILSGFACAVPAMMATRNIRSSKERWIAMFIIPLMTCSARLPVYALLLSFLLFNQPAWQAGLALAVLYFAALILGSFAAAILNRLIRETNTSMFMMELPLYHRPKIRVVLNTAFLRTKSYIYKAGPVIFTFALLVWLATSFPRHEGLSASEQLKQSYAGQVGRVLEPIFEPMGSDWRVGVSLLSAFAAREVFVSSLAVIFGVTSDQDDNGMRQALIESMNTAQFENGNKVFTVASVMALLVFFMIALQCLSTTGMAQKEMASIKFAVVQLISLNVFAYILAILTYKILFAFGF